MDTKSAVDWVLLFTPLVTGFITGQAVGQLSDAGKTVKARPPGWVFGVVWAILYLLLGYAWAIMRREGPKINVFIGLLVASLIAWIIVYQKVSKKSGLYVIVISLLLAVLVWSYSLSESKQKSKAPYLIAPLVIWLVFATMLNFEEVNNS